MTLYGGIDLHSNNNVVALTDENDRIVYRKRLATDRKSKPPRASRLARGRRLAGVGCGVSAQLRG